MFDMKPFEEFVAQWSDEYDSDRKAALAAVKEHKPDFEVFEGLCEIVIDWLCTYREEEPVGAAAEMFAAAIKAAVEHKADGEDAMVEAIGDVCEEVFWRTQREADEGKRKRVAIRGIDYSEFPPEFVKTLVFPDAS